MRKCYLAVGIVALAASLALGQERNAFNEYVKLAADYTDVLKAVKDMASAEAALPKLKPVDKKFAELMKALDIRGGPGGGPGGGGPEFSKDEEKLLATKGKALEAELVRIDMLPKVMALFSKELSLFQYFAKAQVSAAKIQIKSLDIALRQYFLKNNEYPKSLNALTEGDDPILQADFNLLDPWKKPYQYDPKGPKNNGETADVWTVTRDNVVIGNWEEKKK